MAYFPTFQYISTCLQSGWNELQMTNFTLLFRKKLDFFKSAFICSPTNVSILRNEFPRLSQWSQVSLLIYTKWILYFTWGEQHETKLLKCHQICILTLSFYTRYFGLFHFTRSTLKYFLLRSHVKKLVCVLDNYSW